ncbi:TerC family protein [Buchnera aphidicola (Taiwanaphis decaspermi)]|uniref:TerC family protein n=1 Tax=Buchnera aphidicola TaxID=9 RepID=UPI0031B8A13B
MYYYLDPSILAGLITLITLEIVLGIDNLVFVAILIEKLPPIKRDKARLLGLSVAIILRLILLSLMSWMVTLTTPVVVFNNYLKLSGKDLILLMGGSFLLFKAITELHEKLENKIKKKESNKSYTSFIIVVIQIIILDAIFSLDSVVTSVGIVNNLFIMMTAVIIAMVIMLIASKTLTNFINSHQTVVVLCLSFLLMIGTSLVAESFGFYIQKGYLYAAIGFSILIELFNQIARHNFIKNESKIPVRQRASETIIRLMSKKEINNQILESSFKGKIDQSVISPGTFKEEEKYMVNGVLTLASRSIHSIMTPRSEISWVNTEKKIQDIYIQLLDTPHSLFPVCKGELDKIIGIVRAKELLVALDHDMNVSTFASQNIPIIIPESSDPINLLEVLRKAKGSLVIVTNEFGIIQGLITPLDVLEAIAGEFPDADETPDVIVKSKNRWIAKGGTDLHSLQQLLGTNDLIQKKSNCVSLAGLLINHKGKLLSLGNTININNFHFKIIEATKYRIDLVEITKINDY